MRWLAQRQTGGFQLCSRSQKKKKVPKKSLHFPPLKDIKGEGVAFPV